MFLAYGLGVSFFSRAACRRLLLAAFLAVLPAATAQALSVATVTRADTDSLILQFSKRGTYPTIARTGPVEISLTFPPGALSDEPPPAAADFHSSRLLEGVKVEGDTVLVRLKSDAFGFVGWPEGEQGLKLQVYRDPAGANWLPGAPGAAANTTWPPVAAAPKPASSLTLPVTPPNHNPGPLDLPPLPPTLAGGAPGTAPAPAAPATDAAAGAAKEPFYAVPSSMRATALRVGPDKSPVLRPAGLETASAPEQTAQRAGSGPAAAKAGGGELRQPVKLPPIPPEIAA
ncbi:hypothetical protein GTA51_18285, partial [Desulfovibrio aerotolerans]|nr:hypothetical protein [Solidesulfovibrio aerotolerans]